MHSRCPAHLRLLPAHAAAASARVVYDDCACLFLVSHARRRFVLAPWRPDLWPPALRDAYDAVGRSRALRTALRRNVFAFSHGSRRYFIARPFNYPTPDRRSLSSPAPSNLCH